MAAIGYRKLLGRNRDYRYLWFAEIISFLGDWFNTIALYAIVHELSGTGRAFAGVMIAKTLPIFLMTPVAGPLVDRLDRRRLMIASDIARAVLVIGLIVAHRAGSLTGLYGCLLLMVAMAGVFIPARSAAIPQVTTDEELASANALSGATWSVMLALGAAIGGWVTAAIGTDAALVLDGGTFLVSAGFLAMMRPLPAPGAEGTHHDRSFVGGLRYLVSNRRIFALASLKPLMALSGGALVLIPVFGTSVFPGRSGPIWMGLLYSARGLGALVGSAVLIRIFGDSSRTMRRLLVGAYPIALFAYFGLALAPGIAVAALAYFVAAIASGANWVMSGTLIQREVDRRYLGRVFSVEFGTMTLVISLAGWVAGATIDVTEAGPRAVVAASALALIVPFLFWGGHLLSERRRIAEESEASGIVTPMPGVAPEAFDATHPSEEDEERGF